MCPASLKLPCRLEIVVGGSIRRHRFYPDAVCLSTAIDVLCKLGQPEKAMDYMVRFSLAQRCVLARVVRKGVLRDF